MIAKGCCVCASRVGKRREIKPALKAADKTLSEGGWGVVLQNGGTTLFLVLNREGREMGSAGGSAAGRSHWASFACERNPNCKIRMTLSLFHHIGLRVVLFWQPEMQKKFLKTILAQSKIVPIDVERLRPNQNKWFGQRVNGKEH